MPDKTCPFCGRRFDASVRFCQDDGTPLTLTVGTTLAGRYEIVRELGRGAMGVVYLAHEKDLGDRPCAVKILRVPPGTSREAMAEAVARLKREATMLGSLGSHPNLVTVYTAGQDDDGLSYIVMEYVDGETLKEKFALGTPFTVPRAVRIVRQIANGLEHAHAQGVVHRDLKPGNVILTRRPETDGWVKIVDFGIAKAAGPDTGDLTRARQIVGTPRYMSPEQRAGKPLDARSDVFSFALIAAELLSDERGVSDSGAAGEVPADLTAWPDALKQVLARGLASEPAHRFSSARAFADAFASATKGWEPDDPGAATAVAGPERPSPTRGATRWIGAAAVASAGLAVWAAMTLGSRAPPAGQGDPPTSSRTRPVERDTGLVAQRPAVSSLTDSSASSQPPENEPRPRPAAESATVPDFGPAVARLRGRVDPTDPDTVGLGRFVVEATDLIGTDGVPDTLVVEVRYLRAEAQLIAGREDAACSDLETIRVAGESDGWVARRYGRAVAALLALNCEPGV